MSSITGYFFDGSKFVGRMMMPQMSVLPSRPLATKTSGDLTAGGEQRRGVALLEIHHQLPVLGAAQLRHRRQVHARPGVHVILHGRAKR